MQATCFCTIKVCYGVTSVTLCDRWLPIDFRYAPLATEVMRRCKMLRRAKTGRERMQQRECRSQTYSITSSTVICMISGTVRPSALAVLDLWPSPNKRRRRGPFLS